MKGGGGARVGSGRKPMVPKVKPMPVLAEGDLTPLQFLLSVMNDQTNELRERLDAAKTAAQYVHLKKGDGGIKDERQEAAIRAGAGKFGASAPPRLVSNRGA